MNYKLAGKHGVLLLAYLFILLTETLIPRKQHEKTAQILKFYDNV